MGQLFSQPDNKIRAYWEWKSNLNPWSADEEATWSRYKHSENYLLEKAYRTRQKQVDLGDYEIFYKGTSIRQKRKIDSSKERLVRRVEMSMSSAEEMKLQEGEKGARSKRFLGIESPKCVSSCFSSLKHFLQFLQSRGLEVKKFDEIMREVEISNDLNKLNENVIPLLLGSFKTESAKMPVTDDNQVGLLCLLTLFEKTYFSWREYYGDILKAYSMDTFVYHNLNRCLCEEDWSELQCLLPFLVCLCKAFLCTELSTLDDVSPSQIANQQVNDSIILYRGAQLDTALLSLYSPDTMPYFSWNTATCTTTSQLVAEEFLYSIYDHKKTPVLFKIEVPWKLGSLSNPNLLKMKPFSVVPEENEVIIAPGSIFEVRKCFFGLAGAEVHLRLVDNITAIQRYNRIMHGTSRIKWTTEMIPKVVRLVRELDKATCCNRNNKLTEELELAFCELDIDSLEDLRKLVLEAPRLKKITLLYLYSEKNSHVSDIIEVLTEKKLNSLKIADKNVRDVEIGPIIKGLRLLCSLTSLTLDFSRSIEITDEVLHSLSSECLGSLSSLTTLILNFEGCKQITDKGLSSLSLAGLSNLPLLATLTLNLGECFQITDDGVFSLSSTGFNNKPWLTFLTLHFGWSTKITDEALYSLSSAGFSNLPSLVVLNLHIEWCSLLTEKGLESLSLEGFSRLSSLTVVNLFARPGPVPDETLNKFYKKVKALKNDLIINLPLTEDVQTQKCTYKKTINSLQDKNLELPLTNMKQRIMIDSPSRLHLFYANLADNGQASSIKSINISRESCSDIAVDEDIEQLCSTGLRHLYSLTNLTLNFEKSKLTDQALHNIRYACLDSLTSLANLTLQFGWCGQLTDDGLQSLSSLVLSKLTSLTLLSLNFEGCDKITDKGLHSLSSAGLCNMRSLNNLSLHFNKCKQITDQGLHSLSSIGLSALSKLTVLNLYFQWCYEITNQGLDSLNSEGLIQLSSLTTLGLYFEGCGKISDKGHSLCSMSLSNFLSLTTLTLDFGGCFQTTDKGLYNLSFVGFNCLPSLISLNLHFGECYQITDKGIDTLSSSNINRTSSLTVLTLDFEGCRQITDKCMHSLSASCLSKLTSLTVLTLNFKGCHQITDEGINSLSSPGFNKLSALVTLTLNFQACRKITDKGLYSFSSLGLSGLLSLTTLDLNFAKCREITNKGISMLSSAGLSKLSSLTALNLQFGECEQITDKGLNYLSSKGLRHLSLLRSLSLSFGKCKQITDKGLDRLSSIGLNGLFLLKNLSLHFGECGQITDEGLECLASVGLSKLSSLTALNLQFEKCEQITEVGLRDLSLTSLSRLPSLTVLNFDFSRCIGLSSTVFVDLNSILRCFNFELSS